MQQRDTPADSLAGHRQIRDPDVVIIQLHTRLDQDLVSRMAVEVMVEHGYNLRRNGAVARAGRRYGNRLAIDQLPAVGAIRRLPGEKLDHRHRPGWLVLSTHRGLSGGCET